MPEVQCEVQCGVSVSVGEEVVARVELLEVLLAQGRGGEAGPGVVPQVGPRVVEAGGRVVRVLGWR